MKSSVGERIHHRFHPMINSVERDARIDRGEVNEFRETPGWQIIRIQIDSDTIDTVGPKGIAKAFEMKETVVIRRGIGVVVANGRGVKNDGEK